LNDKFKTFWIQSGQMEEKMRNAVFFQWFVSRLGMQTTVAQSTFPTQNVENTSAPEHFLKFWWRKIARRCGAHKFPSQRKKNSLRALLMSKNSLLLPQAAHLEVKMCKSSPFWCTFWNSHGQLAITQVVHLSGSQFINQSFSLVGHWSGSRLSINDFSSSNNQFVTFWSIRQVARQLIR